MVAERKRRITGFQVWVGLLAMIIAAGVLGGIMVFWKGLSITNLTDHVPWGLWIGIDLSSIALGAGAFLLSAAVYLVGIKRLEPVARTAVFIGMIGYSMALLCLLLDIGRPDRFWHAIAFWNFHSPLWEVSMCIVLYFSVLALEVMPIIARLEWLQNKFPKLTVLMNKVHHISPILAIAGLALSVMHQSSLGAMYGVLKAKPIWYRPGLAGLFFISAATAGPALTVFVSMLAGKVTKKAKVNDDLLDLVARYVGWALVVLLYFRLWDTLAMSYTHEPGRNEGLMLLTSGKLSVNFWFGEVLMGMIIPMIILLSNKLRRQKWLRMFALAGVIGGVIAFRWDVNMVGQMVVLTGLNQIPVSGFTSYTPSLIEIIVGAGIVSYGVLAITLGIQYLGLVDHTPVEAHEHEHVHESNLQPMGAD